MSFLDKYKAYFNDFFDNSSQTNYIDMFKARMLKTQNFILFILLLFLLCYLALTYKH